MDKKGMSQINLIKNIDGKHGIYATKLPIISINKITDTPIHIMIVNIGHMSINSSLSNKGLNQKLELSFPKLNWNPYLMNEVNSFENKVLSWRSFREVAFKNVSKGTTTFS